MHTPACMHMCCKNGHSDIAEMIIQKLAKFNINLNDKDKNGYITLDELKHVVKERTGIEISEKHLERMLIEVDCNDDGFIDYEEFCVLMTKSFMRKRIMTKSPSNSRQNSLRKN